MGATVRRRGGEDSSSGEDLTLSTGSDRDTLDLGRRLGALAEPGDVFALRGSLGAGKTCLAQGVARGLGIKETVQSPTFNLLLVHWGRHTLYHFDLYRLESAAQLEDIDFYETMEAGGVSVIEWADRFPRELPADRLDVTLEPSGPSRRRVTFTPHGVRARRLVACISSEEAGAP